MTLERRKLPKKTFLLDIYVAFPLGILPSSCIAQEESFSYISLQYHMMEFRAAKHLKIKRELQKEKSHNRQKKKEKKTNLHTYCSPVLGWPWTVYAQGRNQEQWKVIGGQESSAELRCHIPQRRWRLDFESGWLGRTGITLWVFY